MRTFLFAALLCAAPLMAVDTGWNRDDCRYERRAAIERLRAERAQLRQERYAMAREIAREQRQLRNRMFEKRRELRQAQREFLREHQLRFHRDRTY